jgi:hypothetical protein
MSTSIGVPIKTITFGQPELEGQQLQMLGKITFEDDSTLEHRCLFDEQVIASHTPAELQTIGIQLITEAALRHVQGGFDSLGTSVQG